MLGTARWAIMDESWSQWVGQFVAGKFRLNHYLGGSERSAVFLTERAAAEPPRAAIKLVPAEPDRAEARLSRWELVAQLTHPHLIRIFEAGRCDLGGLDVLYVVTEYAEEDLSQILPQRPLTPDESREMLRGVLAVLAYLHGNGFVHGHLKPSNIMAVADQLKISSDEISQAGDWSLGKANAYSQPEITKEPLSPAADVWSLGITLVEALTQRVPAWGKAGDEEPVVAEALPEPFREIARNCLRVDPQQRWTVGEIGGRLEPKAARQPEREVVPRREPVSGPQKARRRYLIPAALVAVVAVALLVGWVFIRNRQPEPASARAPQTQRTESSPHTPIVATRERKSASSATEKGRSSDSGSRSTVNAAKPGASMPADVSNQPAVLHPVVPEVPQRARDTIRGTVRVSVRVAVAPAGNVSQASLDSRGPSQYFASLALQAARGWKFAPADVNGRKVASEWILRFEFQRTGTRVLPEPGVKQ